jgi:hypothetical protein
MKTFKEYLEVIQESKEPKQNNNSPSTNKMGITSYTYIIHGDPKSGSQRPSQTKGNLQTIKADIKEEILREAEGKTFKVTIYGIDRTTFIDNIMAKIEGQQVPDRIRRLDKFIIDALGEYPEKVFKNVKDLSDGIKLNLKRDEDKILPPTSKTDSDYNIDSDSDFDEQKKRYFD